MSMEWLWLRDGMSMEPPSPSFLDDYLSLYSSFIYYIILLTKKYLYAILTIQYDIQYLDGTDDLQMKWLFKALPSATLARIAA
jgi:hypothetical protein